MIGPALSSLQTPQQILEDRRTHRKQAVDDIDPEIEAEIIQRTLDQHYRRVLDEPVPALGDKTPCQYVRSKKDREMVSEWLKLLENSEQRRDGSPMTIAGCGMNGNRESTAAVPHRLP